MTKKSMSLCFTSDGLINPETISYIKNNKTEEVVLFSDGTHEALNKVVNFNTLVLGPNVKAIGLGKTPLYELRVINQDGTISRPNYVYSSDVRVKWICAKVCAPHMEIHASSANASSTTQVLLDRKQTESVCYMAYRLWSLILTVEERMGFPAALIEKFMYLDHLLTDKNPDIETLRSVSGVNSLAYSSVSDVISVILNGDAYTIKLSILNEIYEQLIIPFFNGINGKTMKMRVAIKGLPHFNESPVDMSYELLGRIVEDMRLGCREKKISETSPIASDDLLQFAKKVKIDDETCLWIPERKTAKQVVEENSPLFLRSDDNFDDGYSQIVHSHLQLIDKSVAEHQS